MTSMVNMRRVLSMVLMVLMVVTLGSMVRAEAETTTVYAKEPGYLYETTNVNSEKLMKVEVGTKLALIKSSDKWVKVTLSGKTGYMQRGKVTSTKPGSDAPVPVKQAPKVKPETVRIASEPVPLSDGLKDNGIPKPKVVEAENFETLKPGDTGAEVKKLQNRLKSLGWFWGDVGGNYMSVTTQAVIDFQKAAKLRADGIADEKTLKLIYSSQAPRQEITGKSTASSSGGKVYEMDWWTSNISNIFAKQSYAVVTDVETGISFRVYRSGGTNHADVQPETAADSAAMKKAFGGNWSWNRRAIWVSIGGKRYAASMNGMPHGDGEIQGNDFNGHFCIHFTNSRTHGTNQICPDHQAMIQQALAVGNA